MTPGPGLVIAAPASGSGKTTLTLALLRAFRRAGVRVRSAKAGPDYVDPAFHAAASDSPCLNLDPWAMRPGLSQGLAAELAADGDLLLIEGAMGLFDGARDGSGSTADLAALLGLPVLLVVDARGQGASIAALVEGFLRHRPDVAVAGVMLNRVGSASHTEVLRQALLPVGLPVLGALPRADSLTRPERHLGLVPAGEQADLAGFLDAAAELVARHVDLDGLRQMARPLAPPSAPPSAALPPLGQRIAVACDTAFAFSYPHLLDSWRRQGAEVLPFSPLADEAPSPVADAVYLPGGYPELHAGRIASAGTFRQGMAAAAAAGALIYGECGGYMVLGRGLVDATGARHPMLGLLPLETSFATRRLHLGYRRISALDGLPFADVPRLRGHEFHYSTVLREDAAAPLFRAADARGAAAADTGLVVGRVCGSFMHVVDAAP